MRRSRDGAMQRSRNSNMSSNDAPAADISAAAAEDVNNNFALPALDEIDWDQLEADFTPPEWDQLLSAAGNNDLLTVRQLVEIDGVPVTHSNSIKQTALHIAALWGHVETSRYLIERGAEVNAANTLTGATPLHMVLSSNRIRGEQQTALAYLLVEEGGADPVREDNNHKVPLEIIPDEMRGSHPLFKDTRHADLLRKMTPPPQSRERIRNNFLRQIVDDMPLCAPVPKVSREA